MIRGRQQRMIRAGSVLMLGLEGRRRSVLFVRRSLFGRRRLSHSAAGAAVIADAVDRRIVVDDGGFVGVVDDSGVYVGDGCIVAIHTAVPGAANKAHSGVTEPIVNSAIKAHMGAPIAAMPDVHAPSPAPIARRPEQANCRGDYPRARNPVVSGRTISPISGRPDISRARTNRLRVNRQSWRTDVDRNADSYLGTRDGRHR